MYAIATTSGLDIVAKKKNQPIWGKEAADFFVGGVVSISCHIVLGIRGLFDLEIAHLADREGFRED